MPERILIKKKHTRQFAVYTRKKSKLLFHLNYSFAFDFWIESISYDRSKKSHIDNNSFLKFKQFFNHG